MFFKHQDDQNTRVSFLVLFVSDYKIHTGLEKKSMLQDL